MKKFTIAIIAITVVAFGGIFVFGQKSDTTGEGKGFGKAGHHQMRGMRAKHGMGMLLRGLDLTDAQKEQVKSIISASREGSKPLREQVQANHKQIQALSENGSFDEAAVSELANRQGALHAQMIVERERVKSQIFAILTPEQKAKAAEMKAQFKQKMQERMKNRTERKAKVQDQE